MFYTFYQDSFRSALHIDTKKGLTHDVIIEAENEQMAIDRARIAGMVPIVRVNEIDNKVKWASNLPNGTFWVRSEDYVEDWGSDTPSILSVNLSDGYSPITARDIASIHMLDGRILILRDGDRYFG